MFLILTVCRASADNKAADVLQKNKTYADFHTMPLVLDYKKVRWLGTLRMRALEVTGDHITREPNVVEK